ncbi:MAG: isochorismate synthase [Cyanobacteria bacterium P01_F01_bin.53]
MPAALNGIDPSDSTPSETTPTDTTLAETLRFLNQCQQQAIEANHPKIASITFPIDSIAPWTVLSVLGKTHHRHVYYDSPQQWALVGIDVAVGNRGEGQVRFEQAQHFIQTWRTQFIYAEPLAKAVLAGRFFCSATFFDEPTFNGPTFNGRPDNRLPENSHHGQNGTVLPDSDTLDDFDPIYVFVPQVQVMTLNEASTATFNCLITATTDLNETLTRLNEQLSALDGAVSLGGAQPASQKVLVKDVADFEGAVTAALGQLNGQQNGHINGEQLHKVVLADVMDVVAPQAVDVVRSLQTLRQNHPDCTVFSVGNGQGQSFIGASPERLLSINEGRLMTDALAGSASRGDSPEVDAAIGQALLESEKERYEHRVVVEFITRQLRSLGLDPQYGDAPNLLQLLHIQHLHTPIRATLNPNTVSPLAILAKLHPTPAVAGVPRQVACQLIQQYETFDRGLYAAPVGWIDTEGNSEFIVGIRSALINGCQARLYAGAGIVAGSEPAKELAEIKLKLQTLLNALV